MNHSLLPSIRNATLPQKYEAAKVALLECNRIDECKDWADKAAALGSYARQSQDKEMEKTAMRIRARAVQRCGQLLKEIEKVRDRTPEGTYLPSGRKHAAIEAGLSSDQTKAAIRVANVPPDSFEQQVENDPPATVTALAEQGKKIANGIPIYEKLGMTKQVFQAGMYFRGELETYVKALSEYKPQDVVEGSTTEQRKAIRRNFKLIEMHHNKIRKQL